MARTSSYTDEDYEKALALLPSHVGNVKKFNPPGLPSYPHLCRRAARLASFKAAFLATSKARAELQSFTPKIQRESKFTPAQYDEAVEAFATWEGLTNDFKPDALPQYFTLSRKARRDKAFGQKFASANARRLENLGAFATDKGRAKYSDDDYDKYLDAIRTSECRCKSDFRYQDRPGLPNWNSAKHRAQGNPDYAAKLQAALESKGWQKGVGIWPDNAGRFGRRAFKRYDDSSILKSIEAFSQFTGSSDFYYTPPPGLPGYPAIKRSAQTSEAIAASLSAAQASRVCLVRDLGLPLPGPHRVGRGHKRVVTSEQIAAYISDIRAGSSPTSLRLTTPFSKDVRQRLCRENPAFAASVAQANRERLETRFKASEIKRKARERERSKRRRGVYEIGQLRIRLNLNDYYVAANAALSGYRQIPEFELEDIRSDMVEAMIDGSLRPEEAEERAFEYVGQHNRAFSSRKNTSIDQRRFEDGSATVGDYLTTDDYSYAE